MLWSVAFVRASSPSGCVVDRVPSSSRAAARACALIRDASTSSTLTMTTTTTTTTNPMIRPVHQPPSCGSANSFNAASNPARNVLALDQAWNAAVSLLGSQLACSGQRNQQNREFTRSLRSITSRGKWQYEKCGAGAVISRHAGHVARLAQRLGSKVPHRRDPRPTCAFLRERPGSQAGSRWLSVTPDGRAQ